MQAEAPKKEELRIPGDWKPTIHWWTIPLLVGLAGGLVALISYVVYRLGRAAEDANWPDAERLRKYRDPPASK
jgi:hypothetical protein